MFYPKTLLYGSVPIIDLRKCQRILTEEYIKSITSRNICAGGQWTADTCFVSDDAEYLITLEGGKINWNEY